MECSAFYTNDGQATPLLLINQSEWHDFSKTLTEAEKKYAAALEFNGNLGNCCVIYDNESNPVKALVGAGKNNTRHALASAALHLPAGHYKLCNDYPHDVLLYWSLAQYRFLRYKNKPAKPRVLCLPTDTIEQLIIEANAIFMVRDLINTPANDMTPKHLAEAAHHLATEFEAEFKQWIGDELIEHNFPAIYTVGQAAHDAPRLIQLSWGQNTPDAPLIALVGKGVCFDTGGLDIKPGAGMRIMKKDMGGAAHVLGLAQWIMASQLPVRLVVLIPAVENSISGNAFRPGDIITMRNKLTVEVDNTDAEGRLIVADALVKANEMNPEIIIDFATLTGAARVAVGTEIAAFFTNQSALAKRVGEAAARVDESVWELPLHAGYESLIESSIADLSNCTPSPYAGAITAALFLQHFTEPTRPWLHFDIMAWNLSNKPGKPEGGEAMGLRTMIHYLKTTYTNVF